MKKALLFIFLPLSFVPAQGIRLTKTQDSSDQKKTTLEKPTVEKKVPEPVIIIEEEDRLKKEELAKKQTEELAKKQTINLKQQYIYTSPSKIFQKKDDTPSQSTQEKLTAFHKYTTELGLIDKKSTPPKTFEQHARRFCHILSTSSTRDDDLTKKNFSKEIINRTLDSLSHLEDRDTLKAKILAQNIKQHKEEENDAFLDIENDPRSIKIIIKACVDIITLPDSFTSAQSIVKSREDFDRAFKHFVRNQEQLPRITIAGCILGEILRKGSHTPITAEEFKKALEDHGFSPEDMMGTCCSAQAYHIALSSE